MANYLYNGVELPALPEWDKDKYPYANIIFFEDSLGKYYKLTVSAEPVPEVTAAGYFSGFSGVSNARYGVFDYETEWEEKPLNNTKGNIIWANHDISTEDGTLYLAASDPVPVGGAELDSTSFLQGWLVGRRLAGMRAVSNEKPNEPPEDESTKASIVDDVLVVTGNGTAAIVGEVLVVTGGGTAEIVDGVLYVK